MTTRTDVHRPSVINPDDYEFVAFIDHRADAWEFNKIEREQFRRHMERTGGKFSNHEHGGICHVCGNAHAMSVARFYHRPSNSYIEVGSTCMDKLGVGDPSAFLSFKEKMKAGIEAKTGKAKAQAYLDEHGLSAAWDVYTADRQPEEPFEEATIRDIVNRLVRYGYISEKQEAFVARLIDNIATRAQRAAQRAADEAAAQPIPVDLDGQRVEIEGRVVSVKSGDFGPRMLVVTDDGWKVFGAEPRAFWNIEQLRGQRVRFTAKIKVSDRDPKFGFFNRPTKPELIAA